MSQAECFCGAEKRMKVSGSQIAKLKSFHGLTKDVASTGVGFQPRACDLLMANLFRTFRLAPQGGQEAFTGPGADGVWP